MVRYEHADRGEKESGRYRGEKKHASYEGKRAKTDLGVAGLFVKKNFVGIFIFR